MNCLIDLKIGDTLSQAEWITVTQPMINQFADATGDHQWIHLDSERCKNESPFKTTIAHGFLTASLMPKAFAEVIEDSPRIASTINYGIDKLRFLEPVRCNDGVKFQFTVVGIDDKPMGALYKVEATAQLKSCEKPALIGTFLMLAVLK